MAGEMTILGSAVLTLLLAGYLAQQYLPLPTPKVIGIDLGTTYCSVGVFFPGTGKVKVIPDENGHISIPSMVSFTDSDVYVGYESLELADSNPQNTIYDAKRFIGKIFTPEELEAEVGRYPFKVLNKNGMVEFSVTSNETITVTPEYVGSRLLLKLKEMAEEYLGMPVANAVISVPAEFDLKQRNSTIEAANLAGNNKLGGQDFNQRLLQYLYKQIYQTYGFLPSRKEEIHRLRQAVEMVKLNLTLHQSAQLSVLLTVEEKDKKEPQNSDTDLPKDRFSPADGHHVNSVVGAGLSEKKSGESQVLFETEISRKLFDNLNEDLFQKILVPIQQVLKEGHLEKTEIDEVVLVGGSTRIPRIRQVIQEFFGKDPNTSVDPDLAVVTGVAIQAGIDGGSWPLQVSALEIPNKHLQKTNFN
ncbi:heat shock 70 kDa protein 13 isoform X2 [Enhydra lutris kenyoni]|uniref:Heat shock 70 kDa protein 13 isoform X2 n=1 Tax=Enhydra lutris kenyoni TaxID=391180 RepID=A0A2Y9JYA2_ENHLU|nr:heat shock 70 kDa protein 13 isoform X2 [Enhydra lutris kenyoni]